MYTFTGSLSPGLGLNKAFAVVFFRGSEESSGADSVKFSVIVAAASNFQTQVGKAEKGWKKIQYGVCLKGWKLKGVCQLPRGQGGSPQETT